MGLKKLVVYYDANDAQISGTVSRSDSVDYATVFDGLGWNVQTIDGHDHSAMHFAIETAKVMDKPSIIIGNTIMAKGSASRALSHDSIADYYAWLVHYFSSLYCKMHCAMIMAINCLHVPT